MTEGIMFSVMHCGRRVALCSALVFSFAAIPPVFARQTVEVVIQKYRFEPAEVQIRAGRHRQVDQPGKTYQPLRALCSGARGGIREVFSR
jgi:hypothetical protein